MGRGEKHSNCDIKKVGRGEKHSNCDIKKVGRGEKHSNCDIKMVSTQELGGILQHYYALKEWLGF